MAKSSSSSKAPAAGSSAANRAAIIAGSSGTTAGVSPKTTVSSQPSAQNAASISFGGNLANSIKTDPVYSKAFNIAGSSYSGGSSSPRINFNASNDFGASNSSTSNATYNAPLNKSYTFPAGSAFNISNQTNPRITTGARLNFNKSSDFNNAAPAINEEERKRKAQEEALAKAAGVEPLVAGTSPVQAGVSKLPISTSGTSFTNWKKTNPAGTYEQWKTAAAAPASPVAPVAPVAEDASKILPENKNEQNEPPAEPAILNNPDLNSQLNAIQAEYLASLMPTAEEQAAQAQLDKETAALQQGLVNVEDQPVALPFITGQSAALERRASARTTPLTQTLARLQALRTAKGQMANARLGFTSQQLSRQDAKDEAKIAKEQKDLDLQLTAMTKGLKYDPVSKSFSQDPTASPLDPKEKANLEEGLRNKYLEQSKDFQTTRNYYQRMLSVSQDPSAAGDIALVFSYMKVLDPTSVVREGEFATASNAGSVPDAVRNMWNRVLTGERLGANRQDFITQATNMYNSAKAQNDAIAKEFTRIAQNNGVSAANVILDLNPATNYSSTGISSENNFSEGQVFIKAPDGRIYNFSEMSPEDQNLALAEGGQLVK